MSAPSDQPDPAVSGDGIGYCQTTCPQYDGRRCRLTGFEPDDICEPWVRGLLVLNASLTERVAAQAEILARRAGGAPS